MRELLAILLLMIWIPSYAHDGPAFPVLVDQPIKNFTVSIWADPDTGNGTYQIYAKPAQEGIQTISIESYPVRDKSHKSTGEAQKLADTAGQLQYTVSVPFDSEEAWESEFTVKQKDGTSEKVLVKVDVTPPGPSKWEFALYFLPFLLIGFVWGKAYLLKKI